MIFRYSPNFTVHLGGQLLASPNYVQGELPRYHQMSGFQTHHHVQDDDDNDDLDDHDDNDDNDDFKILTFDYIWAAPVGHNYYA